MIAYMLPLLAMLAAPVVAPECRTYTTVTHLPSGEVVLHRRTVCELPPPKRTRTHR